jgi:hypothetical protein
MLQKESPKMPPPANCVPAVGSVPAVGGGDRYIRPSIWMSFLFHQSSLPSAPTISYITMSYQYSTATFTSAPTSPLAHAQCYINKSSPIHTICLDSGLEHSWIEAYYADTYLPNLHWTECICPLSGNDTHFTMVTMTFHTTNKSFMTLNVCLFRTVINVTNNIIVGTNDLWRNNAENHGHCMIMKTTMESVQLV